MVDRYGLLGKRIKDMFGPSFGPILSGLIGLKHPRDHGVPYSLTEEFVSVYRMHTLLPDKFILRDIRSAPSQHKCLPILKEYISLISVLFSFKLSIYFTWYCTSNIYIVCRDACESHKL